MIDKMQANPRKKLKSYCFRLFIGVTIFLGSEYNSTDFVLNEETERHFSVLHRESKLM